MNRSPSLATRAVLAAALLFGFYLLAAAIVATLLYLPYAEWQYVGRVHIKLALFAIVGASLIVYSVFPRRQRFTPPGPRLDLGQHPRLAALIERVAVATGQSVPRDVYIVPDVNAFVGQRGGVLGMGGRRIMGLGLPLMGRLTVAQFAAVLAHEFGHYHGGDTALGPWIYRTRVAIGRTLSTLEEHSSVLQLPFRWYGYLYLRLTQAISRREEFAADALAARVVGGSALAAGLTSTHASALGFAAFWHHEFVPVIGSGYRASFSSGFDSFMASPTISSAVTASVAAEMASSAADPFDSHPPLRERIAALGNGDVVAGWEGDESALSLLDGVDAVEASLLEFLVGEEAAAKLPPIDWDQVPQKVWVPAWQRISGENVLRLRGLTPSLLLTLEPNRASLAVALKYAARPEGLREADIDAAENVFGASLATALIDRGWELRISPGETPVVLTNDVEVRPFQVWSEICEGTRSQEEWQRMLEAQHVADVDLGVPVALSSATPIDNA